MTSWSRNVVAACNSAVNVRMIDTARSASSTADVSLASPVGQISNRIFVQQYCGVTEQVGGTGFLSGMPDGSRSVNFAASTPVNMLARRPSNGLFRCEFCSYVTNNSANWRGHKACHVGRRTYACEQCAYVAKTNGNLQRHRLTHTEVRRFQCTVCNGRFRQKVHLKRHIRLKHQQHVG